MNKKLIISLAAGLAALILVVIAVVYFSDNKVRKEIPVLSENQPLSYPVRLQVSEAYNDARNKPSAKNLGMLGMVYHSSANYNEAAKCYQLATTKDQDDWTWYYYNGYLEMEMGNSAAVAENFTRVTEINPDIHLAWYYLGNAFKNLRKFEEAEKAFTNILSAGKPVIAGYPVHRQDHFPLSIYARFELARMYLEAGKSEQAEKTLKELIQTDDLFGPSYKLLGNIYNMKGENVMGRKYIDRANDLVDFPSPVDPMIDRLVLMSRSELYLLKKIDEAEQSFHSDWALKLVEHGLQYMPENKYMLSKAIKIYLWKNHDDKLLALTGKHMQMFYDDYIEIKNTGYRIYQKGLYDKAIEYWTRALELKPGDVTIQDYLIKSLWTVGEKQKAWEIMNSLLENNKEDADVIANAVDLMFQFDEHEKAAPYLASLERRHPRHPKVLRLKGEMAQSRGETARATSLLKASFDGDPQDGRTIRSLSELMQRQKMWKDYIALYRKVLESNPNNPEYLASLGETLINCPDTSLRNVSEGMEFSERAFTHYNCPPDVLIAAGSFLSYAHLVTGNKQKALTTISQTINIARRQNAPSGQQAKLEAMLNAIQRMEG